MTRTYDVIIAGGGVAGCAAAHALSQIHQLKVAVIESHPPRESGQPAHLDARVIALASSSLDYLDAWGLDTAQVAGADIKRIHVSDRKHIGQTILDTQFLDKQSLDTQSLHTQFLDTHGQALTRFGKVVRLEELALQFYNTCTAPDYFTPESINKVVRDADSVTVSTQARTISAKLLVIAEGASSKTRELVGIDVQAEDYEQSAVITNVRMDLPHNNCAYERFTKYGPLAFLPLNAAVDTPLQSQASGDVNMQSNDKSTLMSVVWTCSSERVDDIMTMPDSAFANKLSALFGTKLGRVISTGPRQAYPLVLTKCADFAAHRCICIGNAAQSLHPIAGQGFNLGVRDINDLLTATAGESDIGAYSVIERYRQLRKQDKHTVISATDMLVRGFSNHYLPFVVGRNKALNLLNFMPPLKRKFGQFAMGNRGS